jgi:hypothetical protein
VVGERGHSERQDRRCREDQRQDESAHGRNLTARAAGMPEIFILFGSAVKAGRASLVEFPLLAWFLRGYVRA